MKRGAGWLALLLPWAAHGEPPERNVAPPWYAEGEVPIAPGVGSVKVKVRESALYQRPGAVERRRGTLTRGAIAPLFAAVRGPNCGSRWLLVGPSAWLCSDEIEYSSAAYVEPARSPALDFGLPYNYYFVHGDGAHAYASFEAAGDAAPEGDLDRGFYLPIVEVRSQANGARFGRTRYGQWIAMSELAPARPLDFSGKKLGASGLDVAWVRAPKGARALRGSESAVLPRFSELTVVDRTPERGRVRVREGDRELWVEARDVSMPTLAPPPPPVRGAERWIDIELASQTLVAYEGSRPVFATLVSTGKGRQGTETATPKGTFRVWVKLHTSTMDNLEREFEGRRYSIADVPYVQFFHKGVALHAAFWHRNFGQIHSHGCVNLTPEDARFLFEWTGPHLPRGWQAVLPSDHEPGTLIRVR